ncbi:MAG: elongation factor, partial [Pseudomonadota bacterium]
MKTAQEIRVGNVVMVSGQPMVVTRTEFSKSGRNASVVKMKMKNLLTEGAQEAVYKSDE